DRLGRTHNLCERGLYFDLVTLRLERCGHLDCSPPSRLKRSGGSPGRALPWSQRGASTASWTVIPKSMMFVMTARRVCTCPPAPCAAARRNGLPSLKTITGFNVWKERL